MIIPPLPAIRVKQYETDIYLTKFNAKLLFDLFQNHYLKVEKYQGGDEDTYQRSDDKNRIRELSDFLINYRGDDLVKPILPATIIINASDKRDIDFNETENKIIIKRGAKLNIVDGQHRAKSVIDAVARDRTFDFEVPVSIITDLEKWQEAAQFLVINVKQKPVRTDLTLTVLHELEHSRTAVVKRLKKVLKVDAWQLDATHITIALNNDRDNPWHNLIVRPNEDRVSLRQSGRTWTPIRQAFFVDTLRRFCSSEYQGTDSDSKISFLKVLWNTLKANYPEAFDIDTGKNYMLLKGPGVGSIHALTPLLYVLDRSAISPISESLDKLFEKFPLTFWEIRGEGAGNWGTSQKEFSTNAISIAEKIFPSLFDFFDKEKKNSFLQNELIDEETIDKIIDRILDPSNFEPIESLTENISHNSANNNSGCYLLINGNLPRIKVYVGQSVNIAQRINQHSRPFKLYSYVNVDQSELSKIESLLYHVIKPTYRINDTHPPYPHCPFCSQ